MNQTLGRAFAPKDFRRPARIAMATIPASIGFMIARGVAGPASPLPRFEAAPPWPPWFVQLHLAPWAAPIMSWIAVVLGAIGFVAALIASRRGWQPSPKRLIAGSVVAILALMLMPPIATGDPLYYTAYGRIGILGHDVFAAGTNQFLPAGDPVAAAVRQYVPLPPSRYGPVAVLSEEAASAIAGDSVARTLFWLKVWNAVAYLVLVFVLDRLMRPDRMRRTRAHLMWSLNPLLLFVIMADGHNDVLAAALAATALFAVRKSAALHTFWGGVLLVLAIGVKATYALFGAGMAWAVRRSPRALFALAAGSAAVLVPTYLLGGRRVIEATTFGLVSGEHTNLLWYEFAKYTGHRGARLSGSQGNPGPGSGPADRVAISAGVVRRHDLSLACGDGCQQTRLGSSGTHRYPELYLRALLLPRGASVLVVTVRAVRYGCAGPHPSRGRGCPALAVLDQGLAATRAGSASPWCACHLRPDSPS